jgi:hypothetical protein
VLALSGAVDAGVVEDPERGGESRGFLTPVEDEGLGDDDEGGIFDF